MACGCVLLSPWLRIGPEDLGAVPNLEGFFFPTLESLRLTSSVQDAWLAVGRVRPGRNRLRPSSTLCPPLRAWKAESIRMSA